MFIEICVFNTLKENLLNQSRHTNKGTNTQAVPDLDLLKNSFV